MRLVLSNLLKSTPLQSFHFVLGAERKRQIPESQQMNNLNFGNAVLQKLMTDYNLSREEALDRIAAFVKMHVVEQESPLIDRFRANDQDRLLKLVSRMYIHRTNKDEPPQVTLDLIAHGFPSR